MLLWDTSKHKSVHTELTIGVLISVGIKYQKLHAEGQMAQQGENIPNSRESSNSAENSQRL